MRKIAPVAAALLGLAIAGCQEGAPTEPRSVIVPLFVQSEESSNFSAHLKGDHEVPPVDTRAQGQAIFTLSDRLRRMFPGDYEVAAARVHTAHGGPNMDVSRIPERVARTPNRCSSV